MDLTLYVWRQEGPDAKGKLEQYEAKNVSPDSSFLEMMDIVNEDLITSGIDPIELDNDCREGICGTCGCVINGIPHGPQKETTTCQLHMRQFNDGDSITIEPWRAKAFPVVKDLVVNRSALDNIIQSGGYTSAYTGEQIGEANNTLISKPVADYSMDAAACIGCGACVAACPNGSAMLFTSAKIAQLAVLPQGEIEAAERVGEMTEAMLNAGFGNCTNHYECEAACPKGISVKFIAKTNREYIKALAK
ncbi:MAG: succinate dehydrogenase/fumarate reductase iron-sulfur subunit [Desulfuromonas sp.]|nr:succinate dehydrogenase/fumarate reductase iron-sulfur subunit [Desulfuromonas sp.]